MDDNLWSELMRDAEFAVAHKALVESTQDKTTIPESFSLIGSNVLHGKRSKQHTVVIGVPVPSVKLDYGRIELRGDGKLLGPPREFELHSWLRNHHNMVVSACCLTDANDGTWGDGYINATDTTNTLRSGARPFTQTYNGHLEGYTYGYWQKVSVATAGIIVGTDNTDVTGEEYDLLAQVAHGLAPNQLYYANSVLPAPDVWNGTGQSHALTRYFDNFSGGVITIREMGQVGNLNIVGAERNILVARDVISPALDVPFRAQLAVTYTYSLTYSGSGSPLRNFYNMIFSTIASVNAVDGTWGNGYINGLDVGNVLRSGAIPFSPINTGSMHTSPRGFVRAAGSTDSGLIVGSDSTPVSFDNYNINSLIAHGAGAGQLAYSASEVPTRSWDAGFRIMTTSHARTFSNTSGGNVTARECGAIGTLSINGTQYVLMLHDVFSDLVIANGESLRVVYQPKVQF